MCVEGRAAVNASAIPLAVRGPTAEQHRLNACDACLLQQSNTKLMAMTFDWLSVLSDVATSVAFALQALCLQSHSCVDSSCIRVHFHIS